MRARAQVREHLLATKMRKWALIGQHPFVDPTCPPARARRNFARLCARYPEIARRLGMSPLSAYPPL